MIDEVLWRRCAVEHGCVERATDSAAVGGSMENPPATLAAVVHISMLAVYELSRIAMKEHHS